ncbi:class I SAM-dependent methyltransferase [Roseibium sp.]|uniref:class I SAM-dependent methyltransferase n=1 Tax=Roseibium sp. TaxID=1936156 RepID=UPI00329792A8
MEKQTYSKLFYTRQAAGSARSAAATLLALEDLADTTHSVLDVGCGRGHWLQAFARSGAEVHGIDGPWVLNSGFALDEGRFTPFDFSTAPVPFTPRLPRETFDLVTSFEVLEHIPPEKTDAVVQFISSQGDLLLIGAAAPGQGGIGHVNEQWPDYWAGKFAAEGFTAFDCIRPLLWNNPDVEPWYSQNTILYARGESLGRARDFAARVSRAAENSILPLVHPVMMEYIRDRKSPVARAKHTLRVVRDMFGN